VTVCASAATSKDKTYPFPFTGRKDQMETVLEKLGTTESTTLALKREEGGKIRVTSLLWENVS
jgi:hypothetical protein